MHIKRILTPLLLLSFAIGLYSPIEAASTYRPQTTSPSSPPTIAINPALPNEVGAKKCHIVLDFSKQAEARDGFLIYPLGKEATIEQLKRKLHKAGPNKEISAISLIVSAQYLTAKKHTRRLDYWLSLFDDNLLTSFSPKLVIIDKQKLVQKLTKKLARKLAGQVAKKIQAHLKHNIKEKLKKKLTGNFSSVSEGPNEHGNIIYDDTYDSYRAWMDKHKPFKVDSNGRDHLGAAKTIGNLIQALQQYKAQNFGHLFFSFSDNDCRCAFVSDKATLIYEGAPHDINQLKAFVGKYMHMHKRKQISAIVLHLTGDYVLGKNFPGHAKFLADFIAAFDHTSREGYLTLLMTIGKATPKQKVTQQFLAQITNPIEAGNVFFVKDHRNGNAIKFNEDKIIWRNNAALRQKIKPTRDMCNDAHRRHHKIKKIVSRIVNHKPSKGMKAGEQYHIVLDFSKQAQARDGFFIYPLWQDTNMEEINKQLEEASQNDQISAISLIVTAEDLAQGTYDKQLTIFNHKALGAFSRKFVIIQKKQLQAKLEKKADDRLKKLLKETTKQIIAGAPNEAQKQQLQEALDKKLGGQLISDRKKTSIAEEVIGLKVMQIMSGNASVVSDDSNLRENIIHNYASRDEWIAKDKRSETDPNGQGNVVYGKRVSKPIQAVNTIQTHDNPNSGHKGIKKIIFVIMIALALYTQWADLAAVVGDIKVRLQRKAYSKSYSAAA